MIARTLLLSAAAVLACGLAGCGEREKVVAYKQGVYQGKKDTPAWSNAPFDGDKAKWENAIRARNQRQDESRRSAG